MPVFRITCTADTQPTSVVLADDAEFPTYGIRRTDTEELLVEPNTPMVYEGNGRYSFTFDDIDANTTYEIWIKITDGKDVYFIHRFLNSHLRKLPADETVENCALVLAALLREDNIISNAADFVAGDKTTKLFWPCAIGVQEDKPDEFITLYDSGGVINGIIQTQRGPVLIEHGDVQLRVRAARGDYSIAQRKAKDIKEALLRVSNRVVSVATGEETDLPESYKVGCATPISKEAYLGPDEKGRPTFTVNVRTSITRIPV